MATMVEKAHQEIQAEAARQIDIIKNASKSAVELLAIERAAALRVTNVKDKEDHDLLIELRSDIKHLSEDIKELKTGTSKRIDDLETRMGLVEKKVAKFWVTISLYSLAVAGMITLICFHIFS